MLEIQLYSVRKHEPSADLLVYHTDLKSSFIESVDRKIEGVFFNKVDCEFNCNKEIASQKMNLWKYVIDNPSDGMTVLMDCDMLFVNSIGNVLDEYNCDFAYTAKDNINSRCPVNTGIIFFNNNSNTLNLLNKWIQENNNLINKMRHVDIHNYGSADQYSLCMMLGKPHYLGERNINGIRVFGLKSSKYNLHQDWSSIDESCVIHYKTGWSSIVQFDGDFEMAIRNKGWDKSNNFNASSWKPSYDIWKQYEKEYLELK